jgi:hypothetical protein
LIGGPIVLSALPVITAHRHIVRNLGQGHFKLLPVAARCALLLVVASASHPSTCYAIKREHL